MTDPEKMADWIEAQIEHFQPLCVFSFILGLEALAAEWSVIGSEPHNAKDLDDGIKLFNLRQE